MSKFILVYYGGGEITSPEQGAAHMAAWQAWMQGLGEAVVDPGMPAGASKTVSAEGVVDGGEVSGITVLQADTMAAAVEMAQACPHLDLGGTIEVAQAMDMPM
ncbi:MAG: hypothetical protein KUG74_06425 [Rhodobacteraceae bacterium]|nr:hypothetical protein [Paracoccaceae bacterium]